MSGLIACSDGDELDSPEEDPEPLVGINEKQGSSVVQSVSLGDRVVVEPSDGQDDVKARSDVWGEPFLSFASRLPATFSIYSKIGYLDGHSPLTASSLSQSILNLFPLSGILNPKPVVTCGIRSRTHVLSPFGSINEAVKSLE